MTVYSINTFSISKALGILAIMMLSLLSSGAHADKAPVYTSLFSDAALKGYDAVSYFTDGEPAKGSAEFSLEWNGAEWRFASAKNRDLFIADPERYAPQYGGYCAWAVSQGYTAAGDPNVWQIVEGKLYVNYDRKIGEKWSASRSEFIRLANENWPNVLK